MTSHQSPQGPMPQSQSTPHKVVSQVPKRCSRSTPSIGLPSCYPASPTTRQSLMQDDDGLWLGPAAHSSASIMTMMMMMVDHRDDPSIVPACDLNRLHSDESCCCSSSSTSIATQPQESSSSWSSRSRRQRNRALSEVDFAAIMDGFSTLVV